MSTMTENAREKIDNLNYEHAMALATVAQAEAAEKQAAFLGIIADAIETLAKASTEGSFNIYILNPIEPM